MAGDGTILPRVSPPRRSRERADPAAPDGLFGVAGANGRSPSCTRARDFSPQMNGLPLASRSLNSCNFWSGNSCQIQRDGASKTSSRAVTSFFSMKGIPAAPQCGFSAAVVQILSQLAVPFKSVDVLSDLEVREGSSLFELADHPQLMSRASSLAAATSFGR